MTIAHISLYADLMQDRAQYRATLGTLSQAIQRGLPIPQVDYPTLLLLVNAALVDTAKLDERVAEEFHPIPFATHGQLVARCPCCQKIPSMWERTGGSFSTVKAVSCNQGDPWGGLENGCPLYMPPEEFYKATYAQAANVWNVWATHCAAEAANPTPKLHLTEDK